MNCLVDVGPWLLRVTAVTARDAWSSGVLVHGSEPTAGAVYELDDEGNVLEVITTEQEERMPV